jgi:Ca2+-binding RTX toxin-like protein
MFQPVKHLFAATPAQSRPASKTRLRVENLEARELLTAGITLGADGIIRIEGYDDASHGEVVKVRTLTNNSLTAYDDQIQVTMTYGRSTNVQTFDIWKNVLRQSTRAVVGVSYSGLGGNDSFANSSSIAATADGGAGDDRLRGGIARDTLRGGVGNDTLTGGSGSDTLDGGEGTDKLIESADNGFAMSDSLIVWGGGTFDFLSGIEVADITGGDSANLMNAQNFTGTLTMRGGNGNDTLRGGSGANVLYGDAGDDTIYGGQDADKLYGGAGADTIRAGGGADKLYGDGGADVLYGEAGDDKIYAGSGKDYLYGGAGDDYLDGGYDRKVDHLYGEAGVDEFLEHHWVDMDSYFVWEWDYHQDKVHDKEPGEQVYQIHN